MLKKILSISGKPGLYRLISQGKSVLIVESLTDGKRIPSHANEKVISLGDIAIYTEEEEKPLREVFELLKQQLNGQKSEIDKKADNKTLSIAFAKVLPNYDKEKVYPNDMKKFFSWYNLLIEAGLTDFTAEETQQD